MAEKAPFARRPFTGHSGAAERAVGVAPKRRGSHSDTHKESLPKCKEAKRLTRLQNLTEATHMPQNFPALRAGISPETE